MIAQIYQFRKPSVRTVVTRLQQICEIEQVPSDTRAFGVLYEMTEGDMRSCLNTLQFIKNKSKTDGAQASTTTSLSSGKAGGLTVDTLNKATIGRKDQNKSLFSVWEELFQAPYARKSRTALKVLEEGRDGLVKGIVFARARAKINFDHATILSYLIWYAYVALLVVHRRKQHLC